MEIKPLKTFQTADYELSKTMGYTKEFSEQLMKCPLIIGTTLETEITTSGVTINHKLGRIPTGWIVTDKDAGAEVWRTGWDDKTISLDASASANIKIWVF